MSSNHFKLFSSLLIACAMVVNVGCKSETPIGDTSGATPTPAPPEETTGTTTSSVASINAELYLKVERRLQDAPADGARTVVGLCQITNNTGTPSVPTTITCNPTYGGAFSIPEGDLYYSNLYFTVGTARPDRCAFLVFRPYYYMGSVTPYDADDPVAKPGFMISWTRTLPTTPIDCSLGLATMQCYNGPAVALVPGFPNNKALVYLTDQVQEAVSTLTSADANDQNSNRYTMNNETSWSGSQSDSAMPVGYQTYYVGDTAAATAGYPASGPTGYGAAHQDYVVECRDRYFDVLSQMTVKMDDENTTVGPPYTSFDYFHTWP